MALKEIRLDFLICLFVRQFLMGFFFVPSIISLHVFPQQSALTHKSHGSGAGRNGLMNDTRRQRQMTTTVQKVQINNQIKANSQHPWLVLMIYESASCF